MVRSRRWWFVALCFLLAVSSPAPAEEQKDYPPAARARYEAALELQKKGQWKEAVEAFEEAIRLGMKDYPRAHLYKARAELSRKEYETAVARYTDFIEQFGLEKSCRY